MNGIDGRGARQQAVSGDNVFALFGARTPLGTLTGFAYLIDQDEAAVQGFRLSNQTYGARLAGSQALGRGIGIAYVGSYARQSDWHRNLNHYAATYWLAEGAIAAGPVTLTGGQEVLGADDGRALTSVQTPLASLFKFQGWADKFTTTPPNGLRDLYGTAAMAWPRLGPFTGAGLSATFTVSAATGSTSITGASGTCSPAANGATPPCALCPLPPGQLRDRHRQSVAASGLDPLTRQGASAQPTFSADCREGGPALPLPHH